MTASTPVLTETHGPVRLVLINRARHRNAVDRSTAEALVSAFQAFDVDEAAAIAVLAGTGDHFCSGADLKAMAEGNPNRVTLTGNGPMGPTRMQMSKPVIAAVEGYAVAGGLELALWCDMRVAARTAIFGVFCRRFGVPLVDLGTVRLPRLIGHSRAMDMILTGRPVTADEALDMGLVNRITPPGAAVKSAVALAKELAAYPQTCLRNDRLSALKQWELSWDAAAYEETRRGIETLKSGEAQTGAEQFAAGRGRRGGPATPEQESDL